MHLLILDDDEGTADFVATVALERGWSVDVSNAENKFHEFYITHPPDVIMLDLQIGPADGVEQLRFLRDEKYAGVVVMMSGTDPRVLISAQQLGESLGLLTVGPLEKPMRVVGVRDALDAAERRLISAVGTKSAKITRAQYQSSSAVELKTPTAVAQALRANEMELHLQPILSARDYAVMGIEALIRWRDPVQGVIPPDAFIPIAEQDETVIDQLTLWVIKAAIGHYKSLAAIGLNVPIAVNISGKNLHSLDFPDRLAELTGQFQVSPAAIALEITESVAMRDPSQIADILTRLRLKGFSLAIDDFGTGYSSLKALRQMPFSSIKVDQSFVGDLIGSPDALTIVKSVIDLARNMGMASIAEGVETQEVADVLIKLGINGLQGYHFSRPLPFDQFVEWSKKWRHKSRLST